MLAQDGRCKTLDVSADGYTRGEACHAVTLRPRAAAEHTGGLAVLGCHVNQDGRSSSLTAPNGPSQQAVILGALHSSGVGAADVSCLQMHGTGTALGDPIEVSALSAVVLGGVPGRTPLVLGAVKATSGHAEAAAGTAGVLQAATGASSWSVALLPHVRQMNPLVAEALAAGTAKAVVPVQPGPQCTSKSTGVSSFAYQGTNAHAVVASSAQAGSRGRSGVWQRSRCWFTAAAPSTLVQSAVGPAGEGRTVMQVLVRSAEARAHCTRVQGRQVLSPACLLEAASQGVLHAAGEASGSKAGLVLVSLGPSVDVGSGQLAPMALELGLAQGRVDLEDHLGAQAALVEERAAAPAQSGGCGGRSGSSAAMELPWTKAHTGYRVHPGLAQGVLSLAQAASAAAMAAAAADGYVAGGTGGAWAVCAQGTRVRPACGARGTCAWRTALARAV